MRHDSADTVSDVDLSTESPSEASLRDEGTSSDGSMPRKKGHAKKKKSKPTKKKHLSYSESWSRFQYMHEEKRTDKHKTTSFSVLFC